MEHRTGNMNQTSNTITNPGSLKSKLMSLEVGARKLRKP